MSLSHMGFLAPPQPLHSTSCVQLWPFLHTTTECSDHQSIMGKFWCLNKSLRCSFVTSAVSSSVSRLHSLGAVFAEEYVSTVLHSESDIYLNSHDNEARGEVGGDSCHNFESAETYTTEDCKETLRRKRIGLANKGKVPWNKGRKHSPETCARIKERTLEALRDPKIRKKMSESPRLHSEQSKRKIGSSLRKIWAERLKRKQSKEKFYFSWAKSIAEAAKRGGVNEEQLNWDSYERLKVELAFRRLQWDEDKSKEKKMKRTRAEKKVQKRVQNLTQLAQKKLVHKQSDELKAKKKRTKSSKRIAEKDEQTVVKELNISDRLVKIFGKKSIQVQSCSQTEAMIYLQSALEKFDIESIKAEQQRSTVSLAEQIQAAKSKRRQSVDSKYTILSSP